MKELQDRVVLITGAGRGLGREIACVFSRQGAIIAANDITPINLDQTIEEIRQAGGRASDYIFDVGKKMSVQALVEAVRDDWGRIDILINNARVEPKGSLLQMDEWDWRRTMDVNLSAPFFTMQSVGRVMSSQGGGIIVNMIFRPDSDLLRPDRIAYNASETALITLTQDAARELAPFNIRVNAVCSALQAQKLAGRAETIFAPAPDGPGPQARDGYRSIADAVLYLCSSASEGLSGRIIAVPGERKT